MDSRRLVNRALSFIVVVSLLLGTTGWTVAQQAPDSVDGIHTAAPTAPTNPVDESAVPHYFGPNPNWANSPFTVPDVAVEITGDGNGATAMAKVGANGTVTGIDIINPGRGYTTATVNITSAYGVSATAVAVVSANGSVTAITVDKPGQNYVSPTVSIQGGTLVIPASVTPAGVTATYNASVGNATGGTLSLSVNGTATAPLAWNAPAADVQSALNALAGVSATVTGAGSTAAPWVIVFSAAPASVTIDGALLTQPVLDAGVSPASPDVFSVTVGSATGGTFALTVDAATTAPITWNAPASAVAAALSTAGVTTTVTGAGSIADPWVVAFAPAPASFTMDAALLTRPVTDATVTPAGVTATYNVSVGSATGGTLSLSVNGTATALLAWNAPAADVQSALNALAGVSATVTGAGSIAAPWVVVFAAAPASFTINGAGLVIPPAGGATATAYGGIYTITLTNPGSGYTLPTVDFDFPDGPNGIQAQAHATLDPATGAITGIVIDNPGAGYSSAPNVVIRDGTLFDPINNRAIEAGRAWKRAQTQEARASLTSSFAATFATARATLFIQSVGLDTYGTGYTSAPSVSITDLAGSGSGATATARTDIGAVTAITLTNGGSGYVTPGGIKKFTDPLPGLCNPAAAAGDPIPGCPTTGKYIPLAVPTAKMYNGIQADEYAIGLVQYKTNFSSSLPDSLVRGYVQIETPEFNAAHPGVSAHYPLFNQLLDGTTLATGYFGVTPPQYLGPFIAATKDKPVRIVFRNLLPTGSKGDLFLPVDSTLMGSGMGPTAMWDPLDQGSVIDEARNPLCTQSPKPEMCYKDNRATLHLHGGLTPWISDGTPHQWITPPNETTPWPQGVSVSPVPDMAAAGCDGQTDGCMTFYYTNQQSARLMFYHDHAWGITRLNVLAGEAAGYLISDDVEKKLIAGGTIPGAADTVPLVVQDKTFVPQDSQMYNQYDGSGNLVSYGQDPTWDKTRWGGYGNIWYHHVYMTAQNPGDPSGMSAYGRWMYGPWFWPPAANTKFMPIANPYYNKNPKGPDGLRGTADDFSTPLAVPCNLNDPATWQYDTDPFCEPQLIPGTPNVSVGMEQFNDTPIVNGVAYPMVTLEPKAYRFRILNAANDRFFNFQWYVGDPSTASTGLNSLGQTIGATEVTLNPLELAAAQADPTVFPTPVQGPATAGPDWIQIGTEGGFLPAPAVVDGQQFMTWITDPTRFDFGNADLHSLLLAPAERADVIVDFSQFAGKTLILYNDAPAAFPARVPSYDYYTGAPDLSPVGAPAVLPGYGPNTRTVMQVKIANTAPAGAFNLTRLRSAFSHKADLSGVFESGQHPIIVGQAAYNSAYGTNFVASGDCNAPGSVLTDCDGLVRIGDTSVFGFNTLKSPTTKMTMALEPKAIHDEMNSTAFDEFGRMQATLGLEAQPPAPGLQNVTLYPYVNPPTELIDGANLPKIDVTYGPDGLPVSDVKVTPIASAADGTQLWRITHNGVDTHPIHWHLFDVQPLNRVTWDNIIIPMEATELGWKETLRVSPLEDTIVALRPVVPELPWELPNAIRDLSPMMPKNSTAQFNNIDPQGNPSAPIVNQLVNFGWEYVFHCHILNHEEMDMMRPVSLVLPPNKPISVTVTAATGNSLTLSWYDDSINETGFVVQRMAMPGVWNDLAVVPTALNVANTRGFRTYTDNTFNLTGGYQYRVVAQNTVGYGLGFPSVTAKAASDAVQVGTAPLAPGALEAVLQLSLAGPQIGLTWIDYSTNETGFVIERAVNGGAFTPIGPVPGQIGTGRIVAFADTTVTPTSTPTVYTYRVAAANGAGMSAYTNIASVTLPALPAKPTVQSAVLATCTDARGRRVPGVQVTWSITSTANVTSFTVERGTMANNVISWAATVPSYAPSATTACDTAVKQFTTYYYRVRANNGSVVFNPSNPFGPVVVP